MAGENEKVVAAAIRFSDGSILDFSEMDPPEAGTVLTFGGNAESSGFQSPYESNVGDDAIDPDVAPDVPTSVDVTATVGAVIEGEAPSVVCTVTWVAPVADSDGGELVDLKGFRIYKSTDGSTYYPVGEVLDGNILTFSYVGTINATNHCRVTAYDEAGNEGDYGYDSVAVGTSETAPDDVTGIAVTTDGDGVITGTWNPITKNSLWGYVVNVSASNEVYSGSGTPGSWGAWSNDLFYPCRSGVTPRFRYLVPTMNRWYRIQVKALCYGGAISANWSSFTTYVGVLGFDEDTLSAATPVAGTNTLKVSKDAFISYQDSTHYAALGLTGGFYGLRVVGGAISLKTGGAAGSEKITIDSTGMTGYVGTDLRFDLNATNGLTLYKSDIRLNGGGQILLQSVDANNELKLDATNGIRALVSGTAVARFTKDGIELGASTAGLVCKDSGGTFNSVKLNYDGLGVWKDASNQVVWLGKISSGVYGLKVTQGIIQGTEFYTGTTGNHISILPSTVYTAYSYEFTSTVHAMTLYSANSGGMGEWEPAKIFACSADFNLDETPESPGLVLQSPLRDQYGTDLSHTNPMTWEVFPTSLSLFPEEWVNSSTRLYLPSVEIGMAVRHPGSGTTWNQSIFWMDSSDRMHLDVGGYGIMEVPSNYIKMVDAGTTDFASIGCGTINCPAGDGIYFRDSYNGNICHFRYNSSSNLAFIYMGGSSQPVSWP